MNPWSFFDAIYVINLDFDIDRWYRFAEIITRYDIPNVIRFPAIRNKVGSFGCAQSHKTIVDQAKSNNLKNVFIFEDDVEFLYDPESTRDLLSSSIARLKQTSWDVFYIGMLPIKDWKRPIIPKGFDYYAGSIYRPITRFYGRSSYCLNRSAFNIYDHTPSNVKEFKAKHRGDMILSRSNIRKYISWPVLTKVNSPNSYTGSGLMNTIHPHQKKTYIRIDNEYAKWGMTLESAPDISKRVPALPPKNKLPHKDQTIFALKNIKNRLNKEKSNETVQDIKIQPLQSPTTQKIKTFLLTRIGIQSFTRKGRTYDVNQAVDIFINYTIPSVLKQTNKNFEWIIITGNYIKPSHKEAITKAIQGISFRFMDTEDSEGKVCVGVDSIEKQLCDIANSKQYISLRVDADDYMHPELIDRVVRKLIQLHNGKNIAAAGPARGYLHCQNDSYYTFMSPKIAIGLGLLTNIGICCLYAHRSFKRIFKKKYPSIPFVESYVTDKPLYIYNRTNNSRDSFLHFERSKRMLKHDMVEHIKREFRM